MWPVGSRVGCKVMPSRSPEPVPELGRAFHTQVTCPETYRLLGTYWRHAGRLRPCRILARGAVCAAMQLLHVAQYPSANFASSDILSGVHGGLKTIVGVTDSTPSISLTNSTICSETCGPMGQAGVVSVNVTSTLPPSISTP